MSRDASTPLASSADRFLPVPGGRLFVRSWLPAVECSPVPLLLLHDSLGSVELWRDFPALLCARTGRRVVAYDRLGFGRSAPYPGRLPLDFIAGEARGSFAAVLAGLEIERFIVFGHSVGGGMAVHCAAHYGAACVGLITESAQAFVEDRTVQGIEEARELFRDPAQVGRLARYHGDQAAWVLDAWISSWLSPDFADWSLRDVLPQVHCPLLVLHGEGDEYGTPRHPELIGALAAGPAQVEVLPGLRHVPHREDVETVLAKVQPFVSTLP